MDEIRDAIYRVVSADRPVTVRQVFYRLVSEGVIEKTENEYKSTVCRLLTEMRRHGEIPYGSIADNTRWMRKPTTYSGLDEFLEHAHRTYRRALWDEQTTRVEVWLEKEALAGVLYEVTAPWDVPLMVTRGYPSLSFLHEAREEITYHAKRGRATTIYYFGDHDPSGRDIERFVTEEMTFEPVTVERVAVTAEQIAAWNLPTRPTKRSDPRADGWRGGSVEVDAIPPQTLREIAHEHIESHVDHYALDRIRLVEDEEREGLRALTSDYGGQR